MHLANSLDYQLSRREYMSMSNILLKDFIKDGKRSKAELSTSVRRWWAMRSRRKRAGNRDATQKATRYIVANFIL